MNELPLELPAPAGSFLIDSSAAAQAMLLAAPLLEALARNLQVNQSGVLHVVVMDPAMSPRDAVFEQAILYEHSFGKNPGEWDFDYAGAARAKARLSWASGCDSHSIQALAPHKLRVGDSALWGSVVLDGIVVAVSGCEAPYDEAAAGAVAMLLRAHAKTAVRSLAGKIVVG